MQRLKNTASHNKKHLMYRTYIVTINDRKYALKIMGVGKQKVRFDLFIDYESILKYKDVGVEKILYLRHCISSNEPYPFGTRSVYDTL